MNKTDNRIKSLLETHPAVSTIPKRPENALGHLFRLLAVKAGITGLYPWEKHMRDYVSDPLNGVKQEQKERTSARGNLTKELLKYRMSWKVILKGFNFLKFIRVRITIEAFKEDGEYIRESITLDNRPVPPRVNAVFPDHPPTPSPFPQEPTHGPK